MAKAKMTSEKKKPDITGNNSNKLSTSQVESLLKTLKTRFEKNTNRHKGIKWEDVKARLEANTKKLCTIVIQEDMIVAPVAKNPAAKFPDVTRRFNPT